MGNTPQDSCHVQVFANPRVWLEDAALQQLHTTARLPGIRAAVGLPDLHPGRGYPVGAAFFSVGRFYPALVGGDIGCGMALLATDWPAHKASAPRLLKAIGSIDGPLPPEAIGPEVQAGLRAIAAKTGGLYSAAQLQASLGTIGGGNHFAEVQVVDAVQEPGVLNPKRLHLLVHSGSRGLGGAILRAHIEQFGHAGLAEGSPEAAAYLRQHQAALRFAALNRAHIAQRLARALRCTLTPVLALTHNHVQAHQWQGQGGWLHRKGATPADEGLVVIPGSRGDYSHVLRPVPGRHEALDSLAHGAGRKWARSDCMGRLKPRFSLSDLLQTRFGSAVVCADKALVYEEAPQAYKDVDSVVASLLQAGLVQPVARLRPLLTYKKGTSDEAGAPLQTALRRQKGGAPCC